MEENEVSIELYKEIYAEELKIKSSIDSQIVLPMNLIILLLGGGLFLFQKGFYNHQLNLYIIVLGLLFILFACTLAVSILYLTTMFLNGFSTYKYLPLASDLYQKEIKLLLNDENAGNTDKNEKEKVKKVLKSAKIEFNKYLLMNYIDSATHNRKTNNARNAAYSSSKLLLITSIILIALIGFLIVK